GPAGARSDDAAPLGRPRGGRAEHRARGRALLGAADRDRAPAHGGARAPARSSAPAADHPRVVARDRAHLAPPRPGECRRPAEQARRQGWTRRRLTGRRPALALRIRPGYVPRGPRMTELGLIFGSGLLGLAFAAFLARWVLARPEGDPE